MNSSATSDALKVIFYVIASLVLAALVSPFLYQLGKGFAEATIPKNTSDGLHWLALKAQKHDFDTYFNRALMLSAVLLLYPLISSLRRGVSVPVTSPSQVSQATSPWSNYLPQRSIARYQGQKLSNPRFGWLQLLAGFLLAAGLLFAMGWFLLDQNWFLLREPLPWEKALKKSIPPALGASIIEEIIFRGALLGIFIRAFKPTWGIILLSLVFAVVHFLSPPAGSEIAHPAHWLAGFEMLALIGQKFLQPLPMLYTFSTLFLVGLILGYARYATASLWLPIGLHAGWVFAFKAYNQLTFKKTDLPESLRLYIGNDLKEGLLPLGVLLFTGLLLVLLTRGQPKNNPDPL